VALTGWLEADRMAKLREAVIFSLGMQENSDVREGWDACVRRRDAGQACAGVLGGWWWWWPAGVADRFIFASSWDLRGLGVLVPCRCRPFCEIPTQLTDLDARNLLPSVLVPTSDDGVEVRGSTQRRVEDGGQAFDPRRTDVGGFSSVESFGGTAFGNVLR